MLRRLEGALLILLRRQDVELSTLRPATIGRERRLPRQQRVRLCFECSAQPSILLPVTRAGGAPGAYPAIDPLPPLLPIPSPCPPPALAQPGSPFCASLRGHLALRPPWALLPERSSVRRAVLTSARAPACQLPRFSLPPLHACSLLPYPFPST